MEDTRARLDESDRTHGKSNAASISLARRLADLLAAAGESLEEAISMLRRVVGFLELEDPLPAVALADALLDLASLMIRTGSEAKALPTVRRALDLLDDDDVSPGPAPAAGQCNEGYTRETDPAAVRQRAHSMEVVLHTLCVSPPPVRLLRWRSHPGPLCRPARVCSRDDAAAAAAAQQRQLDAMTEDPRTWGNVGAASPTDEDDPLVADRDGRASWDEFLRARKLSRPFERTEASTY